MQIDLHNCTLLKAKEIINDNLIYCIKNNINHLEIIHGYNNGNKIKNYLKNSCELRKKFKEIINIQIDLLNLGKSIIYLKIKI